jgi:hypothetical protein
VKQIDFDCDKSVTAARQSGLNKRLSSLPEDPSPTMMASAGTSWDSRRAIATNDALQAQRTIREANDRANIE